MQNSPADADARSARETSFHAQTAADKSDSAKRVGLSARQIHSQFRQSDQTIGHQAFATSFLNGRLRAIGDGNLQIPQPGGNRQRQAGGAATDYENISRFSR
jgi:hypothetical protein